MIDQLAIPDLDEAEIAQLEPYGTRRVGSSGRVPVPGRRCRLRLLRRALGSGRDRPGRRRRRAGHRAARTGTVSRRIEPADRPAGLRLGPGVRAERALADPGRRVPAHHRHPAAAQRQDPRDVHGAPERAPDRGWFGDPGHRVAFLTRRAAAARVPLPHADSLRMARSGRGPARAGDPRTVRPRVVGPSRRRFVGHRAPAGDAGVAGPAPRSDR